MAAHLVSGAPGSIIWLRFYLPCCWCRQQDLNLRTLNVTTAAEPAQLCLHIGSRLRFAFSSAAHCFCGLTVRRCGHSLCALNFSRFLDRWPGWCSIAVLPCFSASRKVPVTRCGLLLRGTYAAYGAEAPIKSLAGENDSTFSSLADYCELAVCQRGTFDIAGLYLRRVFFWLLPIRLEEYAQPFGTPR